MKRLFSILILLIVSGFCGILVGCGDKYANLSISVSTNLEREEDGSITLYIGDDVADSAELTITMENAPGDFNYVPLFSMSNEIIKVNANNELIENGVKKIITASSPGSTVLTIYTSEGGKSTTLNVNVVKVATGIEFKAGLKFGLVREYGATLNIDYNKYIDIYPTDSNQRTVRYSIVSYTMGGVEIEGTPSMSELYINSKTGIVTIINTATEITSVKVQARIDNSKAYYQDGTVLPDIYCSEPVEVRLFDKIMQDDISLYVANNLADITLPEDATPEEIAALEKITVTDATVKTLIKNIDKINAVDVILKVKTTEDISVTYPTDLLNIPVFVSENNIFNSGTSNYYQDAEGYKYYAYTITATRSTTDGKYADNIYKLNFSIGYQDYIVDGYPINKLQNLICETFIKTFSINDSTIISGEDYDLKVYKTDATNNTKIKVSVANPLNITEENSKFTMSVYKDTGYELIDITKTFDQYFKLTNDNGTVSYLQDEDDNYNVFENNTTFTIKANSVFVTIGEKYVFKISAYRPNSALDKFDGITAEEVDAMKATANVVATITQGIEYISSYSYSLTEYDAAGNSIVVDYEGNLDQDKLVGNQEINIDNINTDELEVAISVGPVGADIEGLTAVSKDTKIVDIDLRNGILTLKPITIGSTEIILGANTLNKKYKIKVNVYNPIENFRINLQNTDREAGVGYYEETDNSLSNITAVLGSPIYFVVTTNPTTAKYKELNYYVRDISSVPHKELTMGERGLFSDENFIFDSENLFFQYNSENAVGKVYQIEIEMINFDNSVITKSFETSTYIPNNYTSTISKATIYNPLKINYENKVADLLYTDDCNSSFSITIDEKNENATYKFKDYGDFVVKVNGFTNTTIFDKYYDEFNNIYWFTVNEEAVKNITSYPQVIYISAQLDELGVVKTSTVSIVLTDPKTVSSLTALDIEKSEIYFKKGVTEDKSISIMVSPSAALNKDLYVKQFYLDKTQGKYIDVTTADETQRVCTISLVGTMSSTQYIYKYNITTMSDNLRAGNAVLVFMPKDKVNFLNQFTTLNAGDVYNMIDLWEDCMVITIQSSDGTKENPYHVSTLNELKEIGQNETTLSKYYVLTANIMAADNWSPIGLDQTVGLSGGLNGIYSFYFVKDQKTKTYRYSITNLNYTSKDSKIASFGLFNKIEEGGLVENLDLTYSHISSNFIYSEVDKQFNFGGIAAINNGTIENCKVTFNNSNITAGNSINFGGVAGINGGTIKNNDIKFSGIFGKINIDVNTISAGASIYIGGIAGINRGTITGSLELPDVAAPNYTFGSAGFDCSANIKVTKNVDTEEVYVTAIGGAVGYHTEAKIENLSIQAIVNAEEFDFVGGIVGNAFNDGGATKTTEIYNSYFCGKVYGNDNVGGVVGKAEGIDSKEILISYSSAENYKDEPNKERIFITGNSHVGGLIGRAENSRIYYSYAVSYFEEDDSYDILVKNQYVGGLIGSAKKSVIEYAASIMNIQVEKSTPQIGAFIGGGSETTNTSATHFFAQGKCSDAALTNIVSGGVSTDDYYSTFGGDAYEAPTDVDEATIWDKKDGVAYLKNGYGKPLFAVTPLTVSAVVKENNDGVLNKVNAGKNDEKDLAYLQGYISNDVRSAVVFLHTINEGSYTQKEIIEIEEQLLKQFNTINIEKIADLSVSPLTNKSARLTIKSSNPEVVYVNDNGTLLLKKEGEVTITIGSRLNSEEYFTTLYLIVRKGITEFLLSESANLTSENDLSLKEDAVEVLKSGTKSLFAGAKFEVELEDFDSLKYKEIENITDGADGRTAFGTRYIVTVAAFEESIIGSTDVIPNLASLFTINGFAWSYDAVGAYYYVDIVYGTTTSINPINATGNNPCVIQAVPYLSINYVNADGTIDITKNRIYLEDCKKEFSVKIIKGAESITFTNNGVELPQLYTLKLVVNMDTNYEEDQILLTNFNEYTYDGFEHKLQIINGLQNRIYDEKGNVIRVTAEYTINYLDKDKMLTENQVYTLNFRALSNPNVKNSYTFTYTPQGILDVGYTLYSKISDYKNNNGSDTNIIYNGQTALLAVQVYPYFSNFDSMEVLYLTEADNTMSIQQYKYDVNNSSFSDYVEGGAVYDKNVGLYVNKATGTDTYKDNENGIYSYSKVYFFGLLVGSDVPDYTDFTIKVKFYKQGEQVEPYDSEFKFTAVSQPTIELSFNDKTLLDNENVYNLPLGTENVLDVKLRNFAGEIEWTITSPSGYELNKAQTLALTPKPVNNKYIVTVGDLENSGLYLDLIGHTFNIKATIYKDDFVSTHDVNFKVTLFTIQSIQVEGVSNEYLSVPVYSTTPLGVEIVYFASPSITTLYDSWRIYYNTKYTTIYGYVLPMTFSDFVNELTVAVNKEDIWYAVSNITGEYEKLEQGKSYSDDLFEVTNYMDEYALYGYRTDITTQMKISVPISYKDGVPGRILTEGEPPTVKEGFEQRKEFVHEYNMIFVYKTGLVNAIPVTNQEEFETMEEGKDYRLINDIELKDYTPISTKIASFDGNNYTIYVTGFSYSSDYAEGANLGLFETVDEETTLYNVKVCYTERVKYSKVDDELVLTPSTNPLIVSLKQANLVYFGGIATTNDGSITNATVEGRITIDVNVNEESGVAIAQTLNGGIVSTNNGYITNSKVENFDFAGYGNTAGVVGINNKIVTATYTNELKLVNKSTNYTGGFVYQNAEDGLIESCYVQGKRATSDLEMRNQGEGVQASGQIGGFVYENIGKIQNCYANISLASSSFLAGFAFTGNAKSVINNCYSICKNNGENKATTSPFSGGTTGNAVSYAGKIENSYYFSNGWDRKDGEQAKALNSDEFATSASFVTFDMANETSLGEYVDGSGEYQYANGYTWMMAGGKPELVATAVKTVSQMKYAGKNKVYSDISVVYPYDGANTTINMGDQLIAVGLEDGTTLYLTYDYTRIINSKQIIFEKRLLDPTVFELFYKDDYNIATDAIDGSIYVWVEEGTPEPLAGEIYEYFIYQNSENGNVFYDSNGKYANGTSVEEYGTLKNIHYLVTKAVYQEQELEVTLDLENNYRANDTITCYYTPDGNKITRIVYQTCESAQYYYTDFVDEKSEMYGSITNPYLIYDYNSFAVYLSSNAKPGVYFRFVRDIDLDYRTPPTMYTVFNGNIQGNFMTIENINITYLSQDETASDGFGLFAEIVATSQSSSVSNLTLEVGEVSSASHNYVGALAGKVSTRDSSDVKVLFSNISVVSVEDENGYVLGKNYVGGLIGYGVGNTQLKSIHTSLWVNATRDFYQANNQYYLYQILKESDLDTTYTVLGELKTIRTLIKETLSIVGSVISDSDLVERYNEFVRNNVSYAGGVVGVLDTNSLYNYSVEEFNANDLTVDGESVAVGVTVGGAIGYVGENTKVKDLKVLLESDQQYIGAVAYAGGVVGENRGKIISSRIEFVNNAVYDYGELDTEEEYFKALNNTSMIAIGGLVGLNIGNKDVTGEVVGGIIENSITNVNVRNNYTLIAGGAVGRMVGGSLNSVISTGSVRAKNIIGGLVGTVNDRISVVHTSTNNYGFIHSNPQLLILPKTDGKADQSYFKQCIAATNWIMDEYGYLDSITRLVAGFIGLETFSTYESTSGIYYSDFGTYENQRSFFANTLFKTSTDVVEKYIPVMFGGRECDVHGIDQADNYYKSIEVGGLQMVYPYAGNKMYEEIPETYTCKVAPELIVNTGTAERDELLTFTVADGWTIECADTISEAIHVIADGHSIKVSKGSENYEFVVGGLYNNLPSKKVAQIVCYAEGDPALEITKVVVSVRATINTATWTLVKTYPVETNKINIAGHTLVEGSIIVNDSNPIYINDVYLTNGRELPNKGIVKEIKLNAIKNESSENVLTSVEVTYKYNVETNEFASESRKVEPTSQIYTLSIKTKAVVYRYLLEDYWNIPEDFYGDINSAESYFPNVNLYLTIKKWEDFTATGFAGGNGTIDTPYLIETPEQLSLMMDYVNSGAHSNKHYKVIKDIDLSGKYWTPIGTKDNPFNGTFDASYTETIGATEIIKFNTIYYTMVNSKGNDNVEYTYAGLFGYVKDGTISNVKTIGGNIQGKIAGGVIGYYESDNILSNIENGNTVVGNNYVGGVVAYTHVDSKITKAINNGKITLNTRLDAEVSPDNKFYIGGVAGNVGHIAIEEDCLNYGDISVVDEVTNYAASTPIKAATYIGGVAGVVTKDITKTTYNYGKVYVISNADKLYVGGVVGYFGIVDNVAKTYYRGVNKAPITVDYKTIDSINDDYAVNSLIYRGEFIDGTAFANIGGVVGAAAGVGLSVNEEKIDFICEYNTNSIISIGGVIGTVYATDTSVVEQNSNVANIESQTPNTSTINIIGGIVGNVMHKNGENKVNIVNNYNTGNIITSATSYQISGGLLGTTIAQTQFIDLAQPGPTYYCYKIGSFSLPGSNVKNYEGNAFVHIYYNYNLGTISISSMEKAYNAVGAIVGLIEDEHAKMYKADQTNKAYNYYLTGSVEYLAMEYESDVFIPVETSSNCVSMLSTTLHNELFERLEDDGKNAGVWENKYLSWYPTLKDNATQVLWENYTENFAITAGNYTINSAEQLAYLAKAVNSGLISTEGKTYILTSTINLENKYFTPIGTEEHPFMGTFDGNGFVVKNMTIDGSVTIDGSSYLNQTTIEMGGNLTKTYAGLFGFVKNATITNVGIEAPIITNVGFAGGIAYSAENSAINYCYVDTNEFKDDDGFIVDVGKITVGYYVGGIVCFAKNCYPDENNNYKARINNCYNNVILINTNSGHTLAGIAIVEHCYVENCYNTARIDCEVVGDKTYTIGPIVATKTSEDNSNYVKYCYSIGDISSKNPAIVYTTEAGLLIDDVTYGYPTISNLTNWQWDMTNVWTNEYTLNPFNPADEVGNYNPSLRGLGQNWKSTEAENLIPYASQDAAREALEKKYEEQDKLLEILKPEELEEPEKTEIIKEIEKTTGVSTRTRHGINFINKTVVGEDTYKYYLIENAEQLALLSRQVNDGILSTAKSEFILIKDIDLSGKYWTPIGKNSNYAFRGIFNFNGYAINGLTIDSSTLSYAGLFGYVKGGKIYNGYINNAFIRIVSEDSTVDLYAGTLAANVYDTTIENIEVKTTIGAFSNKHAVAGGIVATFSILSPHEDTQPDFKMSNVKVNAQGPISCGEYETQVLESANSEDNGEITKDKVIIGAFSKGGDSFVGGIVGKMKGIYTARDQEAVLEFATNTVGIASITLSSSSTAYAGGIAGMISENTRVKVATNGPLAYIKTHSGMYDRTGGIVGYLYDSIVEDCYNDSAYMESTKAGHTTSYLGGIVGFAETPKIVKNCISTAYTRRNYNLGLTIWGGIIGYFEGYEDNFFVNNTEWKASFFRKELGFNKCIGNVVKGSDDENLILEVNSQLIMKGVVIEALNKGKDDVEDGKLLTSVHGFDEKYWMLGNDSVATQPKLRSDIVKVVLGTQLRVEADYDKHILGDDITIVKEGGTDTAIRVDMYYGGYQVSTVFNLLVDGSRYYYELKLDSMFNITGIDGIEYVGGGFDSTALIYVTLV